MENPPVPRMVSSLERTIDRVSTKDPQKMRTILSWTFVVITTLFIIGTCSFKILDRDFWWHLKAGEIMVKTHAMIQTEPFSYTRAGLPYVAKHEWLSQIILYLTWAAGGTTGIILLRTFMMLAVYAVIFSLDWKNIWPVGLVAIFSLTAARRTFMDRPQLFTFLIFAVFVVLVFQYLRLDDREHSKDVTRKKNLILMAFVAMEILWINLHGAAALLGGIVVGCLLMDKTVAAYLSKKLHEDSPERRDIVKILVTCGALAVALILSPSGFDNIRYVITLLSDRTIDFISEWQPRAWVDYLKEIGPLWIVTIAAMGIGRKRLVFCILLFAATGYLSHQAFRHEMLFIIVALAIIVEQLRHNTLYNRWMEWLSKRIVLAAMLSLLLLAPLLANAETTYDVFVKHDNLYGYGVFDLAKGAYDFVEEQNLQGNMFNTYGIGGYLLYRGYPTRRVFIDGRNVDYGYAYMRDTFLASQTKEHWDELDARYNFSYAFVDYDVVKQKDSIPYSNILDSHPAWRVVYVDDWVAVYAKNTPENTKVISQFAYTLLSPETIESDAFINNLKEKDAPQFEKELKQSVAGNPLSFKARIALAKLYLRQNRLDDAVPLLNKAKDLYSHRAEPYALLAAVAVHKEQWAVAGELFELSLANTGDDYPDINYAFIASVFAQAGNIDKARYYAAMAEQKHQIVPAPPSSPSAIVPSSSGSMQMPKPHTATEEEKALLNQLLAGQAKDIQALNDKGIAAANQGKYDDAKKFFDQALTINPNNPEILNNLGSVALQQNDWKTATTYYQQALKIDPKFADAAYNLAIVYFRLRDWKNAETYAKKAAALGRDATQLLAAITNAKK